MYNYKAEQIDSQIAIVARDAGRLQDKIHALGFATLREWLKMGAKGADKACERLNNLQNASPYHANAFSKWVAKYTPLIWNKEEKVWVAHATETILTKTGVKSAKEEPFYLLKPASEAQPYDDKEAFLKFADALEAKVKAQAAGKDNITVHPEFVNKVRELRKSIAA